MKIVILSGSPHKKGTSALLVDEFVKGVGDKHEVFRFDCAFEDVHPCIGCQTCFEKGKCIFDDSFTKLKDKILEADLIVFATPIYYFTMTAQLKAVIDRFYQLNMQLMEMEKKVIYMFTALNPNPEIVKSLELTLDSICGFLNWPVIEKIYAINCGVREDIEKTEYPQKAFEIGKTL